MWIALTYLSIFIPTTPTHAAPPAEQGEEVYDPKTASDAKEKTAGDVEYKSYGTQDGAPSEIPAKGGGFPVSATAPPSEQTPPKVDDTKNHLKEFTRKANSKDKGASATQLPDSKNKLQESNIPVEVEPSNSSATGLKGMLDQGAGSNKVEEEKDVKINANKLVDLDEKVVAPKKYNGIIWFVGVFVVLLVVVFAFT